MRAKALTVWVGDAILHGDQSHLQIFNNGELVAVVNIAPGCAVQELPLEEDKHDSVPTSKGRVPDASKRT